MDSSKQYAVYQAESPLAMVNANADTWLLNNSLHFTRVAVVQAPLDSVFALTNAIDAPWTQNAEIIWHEATLPLRSTSIGDVIVQDPWNAWLVRSVGLEKIVYPVFSPTLRYAEHSLVASALAWSPNGQWIASGDWDGQVRVWKAGTGEVAFVYRHRTGPITRITWSPDGAYIASCNEKGTILVFDVQSIQQVRAYEEEHFLPVHDLRWTASGLAILTGGEDQASVCKILLEHASQVTLSVEDQTVEYAAFSDDGTHAGIACGDSSVVVWDTGRPDWRTIYRDHVSRVRLVAFAPNSRFAASVSAGDDLLVRIWDATSAQKRALCWISSYGVSAARIFSLTWSPDAKLLALGASDGTVQVFDSLTGRQLASYRGHTSAVFAVAFSPNGSRLASASGDQTVQIWRLR